MPQIIVTADSSDGSAVMLCERVNATDFESDHFAAQLVERINWAVEDAQELECAAPDTSEPEHSMERTITALRAARTVDLVR
jgi:hypothetical protein